MRYGQSPDRSTNQLKSLLISGPAELREQLRHLSTTVLITTCANLRPTSALPTPCRPPRPRCLLADARLHLIDAHEQFVSYRV